MNENENKMFASNRDLSLAGQEEGCRIFVGRQIEWHDTFHFTHPQLSYD